jgi:hypothetical protein
VIAPSRPSWRGYQINFAHPRAVLLLVFYLIILVVPVSLAIRLGPDDIVKCMFLGVLVFAASVGFLIALSAHLSAHCEEED